MDPTPEKRPSIDGVQLPSSFVACDVVEGRTGKVAVTWNGRSYAFVAGGTAEFGDVPPGGLALDGVWMPSPPESESGRGGQPCRLDCTPFSAIQRLVPALYALTTLEERAQLCLTYCGDDPEFHDAIWFALCGPIEPILFQDSIGEIVDEELFNSLSARKLGNSRMIVPDLLQTIMEKSTGVPEEDMLTLVTVAYFKHVAKKAQEAAAIRGGVESGAEALQGALMAANARHEYLQSLRRVQDGDIPEDAWKACTPKRCYDVTQIDARSLEKWRESFPEAEEGGFIVTRDNYPRYFNAREFTLHFQFVDEARTQCSRRTVYQVALMNEPFYVRFEPTDDLIGRPGDYVMRTTPVDGAPYFEMLRAEEFREDWRFLGPA